MQISYQAEERFVWAQFTGPWTLDEVCAGAAPVLAECLRRSRRLLLIDLSALTGRSLSTLDRYRLASSTLVFTQDLRKVAVAAYAGMIDRERFGETVAQNRGVPIRVFDELPAAQQWLLEKAGG